MELKSRGLSDDKNKRPTQSESYVSYDDVIADSDAAFIIDMLVASDTWKEIGSGHGHGHCHLQINRSRHCCKLHIYFYLIYILQDRQTHR